jgi:SAM-dependent MidA family methyltransferase
LARPGEQDLTAHVNFTALIERGQEVGLTTLGYVTQAQFLLALARATDLLARELAGASERKRIEVQDQFKQLIHPEAMGEAFKVLLQGKGVGEASLTGFTGLSDS